MYGVLCQTKNVAECSKIQSNISVSRWPVSLIIGYMVDMVDKPNISSLLVKLTHLNSTCFQNVWPNAFPSDCLKLWNEDCGIIGKFYLHSQIPVEWLNFTQTVYFSLQHECIFLQQKWKMISGTDVIDYLDKLPNSHGLYWMKDITFSGKIKLYCEFKVKRIQLDKLVWSSAFPNSPLSNNHHIIFICLFSLFIYLHYLLYF